MNVTVQGLNGLHAYLSTIRLSLQHWDRFWPRIEARLPGIQMRWWDARFDKPLEHAESTIAERAAQQGYYANPRGSRASSDNPYFEWTGSLRESTERFTTKDSLRAEVDTGVAYKGPLRKIFADPVNSTLLRKGIQPFFLQAIENAIEVELEGWLEDATRTLQ